jgi:hypothetical protein
MKSIIFVLVNGARCGEGDLEWAVLYILSGTAQKVYSNAYPISVSSITMISIMINVINIILFISMYHTHFVRTIVTVLLLFSLIFLMNI